jgi:hypothetical protein
MSGDGTADQDDGKPYGVATEELGPRCPECANDMGPDDVICLTCGYNVNLRQRIQTKKLVHQTGFDVFIWLLPGIQVDGRTGSAADADEIKLPAHEIRGHHQHLGCLI